MPAGARLGRPKKGKVSDTDRASLVTERQGRRIRCDSPNSMAPPSPSRLPAVSVPSDVGRSVDCRSDTQMHRGDGAAEPVAAQPLQQTCRPIAVLLVYRFPI